MPRPTSMRSLLILGLTAPFLSGCTTSATRVAVTRPTPSAFHVEVIEHLKDPIRHRPATRLYRFTTPVASIVAAAEIRDYETLFKGTDGTAHEFRPPVDGYLRFSNLAAPQRVEFRLVGDSECSCHLRYPLSINGIHGVSSRR